MLSVLIFFPLIAAMATLLAGENAKRIALIAAIIEFAVSILMLMQFDPQAGTQFMLDYWWVPSLGISFKVGMDGISMLLVLLTTFLTPIIILSSFNHQYKNPRLFYSLILIMQMALVGVFVALD